MKLNWGVIKFGLLLLLIGLLFGFTNQRNEVRKLLPIKVDFVDENEPFITDDTVNKLLIQNGESITSIDKETLVLNEMEQRLLGDPMIRNAEVFVTVEGEVRALIEQRNPIGRVASSPDYYLDADGKKMPLSKVYSARVPLITGRSKNNFSEVTELLLAIEEDDFMRSSIVGVHVKTDGNVVMQLRKYDCKVHFGKPKNIARKFQNFKAFYKKTKQDKLITNYSLIDLQFGNQVVATKK